MLLLGCTKGDIIIFDLTDGTIQRQLAVHSCTVRCVHIDDDLLPPMEVCLLLVEWFGYRLN
jgi:hypothetical protein